MDQRQQRIKAEQDLIDLIASVHNKPYEFVMVAYPWGVPGTPLEKETGPDEFQKEFLLRLGEEIEKRGFDGFNAVDPIKMGAASGHGSGKSVMGAWITGFIMSTRPNSIGTVTAGTYSQLESRTWAAIKKWMKMCITSHWFDIRADGLYSKKNPEEWKVTMQTCKEENAQSFAGQHAKNSTSWYLFDEASEVPDGIWEVAYGGLTDGEPMMFVWGQPVRNSGEFYKCMFGRFKERWVRFYVDSRNSRWTNKKLIQEWIEDYGEDSDFVRVRIFGKPPLASETQFIDAERVTQATKRKVEFLDDDPLVVGLDVSGGGAAWNVFYFRRGNDGRSIPPVKITGQAGRDRGVVIGRAAEILRDRRKGYIVAAMFVDAAFGSPIVERLNQLGFNNVFEIGFGSTQTPDRYKKNMRAFMWSRMKDWLLKGGIPLDENLISELCRPGYKTAGDKLVLESKEDMKKRGEASPDIADALALTFARAVAPRKQVDYDDSEEEYETYGSGQRIWG